MERQKCKLCSRSFANGRALGGHMKAHLAILPLPPKAEQPTIFSVSNSSSSPSEEEEQWEEEEKALIYGLRENPKKSFRFSDPKFSFAGDAGSMVIDRESETESKNPTRRRSKRNRKSSIGESQKLELKKPKMRNPSFSESPTEPEPVSSVSDTCSEEDIAMCLMMLSRDIWIKKNEEQEEEVKGLEVIKCKRVCGKNQCENCRKTFRSSGSLSSHKKICFRNEAEAEAEAKNAGNDSTKIFECPFCYKVFGSGQALGGHKRSHLIASSSTTAATGSAKLTESLIDLNLPAQAEEDEFSVVSDA